MEFTLLYRGPLKTTGGAGHKQQIRQFLHLQLKELWNQPPLKKKQRFWGPGSPDDLSNEGINLAMTVGGRKFIPIVSKAWELGAHVSITLLRPTLGDGSIIVPGGDIDNRIKTIFDAMTVPLPDQLRAAPISDPPPEEPFFCVVQDDALITRLTVETDRLLAPNSLRAGMPPSDGIYPDRECLAIIRVKTVILRAMVWTMDL